VADSQVAVPISVENKPTIEELSSLNLNTCKEFQAESQPKTQEDLQDNKAVVEPSNPG
jgi:hypothetical protein